MDAQSLVNQCLKSFKPPQILSVSEWAQERRYLSPESSAEPGKWRNNRTPYLVGMMDATCQSGVHEIAIMCSAQIGKTELVSNVLARAIDIDPCPILFLQPTLDMAQAYSKDRFEPMVRDTPHLKALVADHKSRNKNNTILHKNYPGGQLTLAGANSPASLASRPVRFVLCDEIDRYPVSAKDEGDPVNLARKRTTTFWNWLLVCVSTPTVKGVSRIEKAWEKSDQRRYFVSCPHCQHQQHLIWERIQYASKGTAEAAPETGVYYICEKCDRPIDEKFKADMVQNGVWQATALRLRSGPAQGNVVGFHLNELYSLWRRWLDVALDYEAAREDESQYRVWVNTSLGLPFERVAGEKLDWQRLLARGVKSNYGQGQVPNGGRSPSGAEVLILTAGVDVQADRLEVVVMAWGKGEECYVIQYEKILGSPLERSVWEQLAHVTGKVYENQSSEREYRIRATCIDSGYLTQEVYHNVRKFRHLHWFAIKGQSGDNKPMVSRPSAQEINYKGEKLKAGIQLYKVGVDLAKETLYARSQIETPGAKYMNFPNDLDSDWYEGFCSEVQVTKHKNGQPYTVWEKLPGMRNEPLDTAGYALAAAHLVGITRINWPQEQENIESQIIVNVNDKTNSCEPIKHKVVRKVRKRGR